MKDEVQKILRRPFPDSEVGKLPRNIDKSRQGSMCDVCGKWHRPAALHLDFVGHAAVTDRLLNADPEWSWEPLAYTEFGLPYIQETGGQASMWIKLTIDGTTRLGVGTASADKADVLKELIGDAIRNAAMRFGVALDLWKSGHDDEPEPEQNWEAIAKQHVHAAAGKDDEVAQRLWEGILADLGYDLNQPIGEREAAEIVAVIDKQS